MLLGSSEAAAWTREYHASTAPQPRVVDRSHQEVEVADLEAAVGVAAPRLLDHPGREVQPHRVGALPGQEVGDVAGAAAHLDHRVTACQVDDAARAASSRTAAASAR